MNDNSGKLSLREEGFSQSDQECVQYQGAKSDQYAR